MEREIDKLRGYLGDLKSSKTLAYKSLALLLEKYGITLSIKSRGDEFHLFTQKKKQMLDLVFDFEKNKVRIYLKDEWTDHILTDTFEFDKNLKNISFYAPDLSFEEVIVKMITLMKGKALLKRR